MNDDKSATDDRSRQIDAAIAKYLELSERGVPPDREAFLAEHAEIVDDLQEFLAGHSVFQRQSPQPNLESDNTTDLSDVPARMKASPIRPPFTVLRYFGDYELLEEIARGGMGVVYKARQTTLNRTVAIKMILAGQLASQAEVDRFHAEAQAAAALDHPNIVPIFEVGQHQGQHYFAMGYVAGESLAQRLSSGPLLPSDAAIIIRDVALAVQFAHEKGVIHRDLKPANILIDIDGHPRVTDFGLAKHTADARGLTATGQVLGTPGYMPPEQVTGSNNEIGPAADVYSLGATLYALLTGRPPFQSASAIDTLKQVLEKQPVALREFDANVPPDLETITLKCLEKQPSQRYATAKQLAEELDRFLTGRPILSRPVGRTEHVWRWCKRNPIVASLAVAVALSLVIGTLASSLFAMQSSRRAEQEKAARADAQHQQNLAEANAELAQQRQREAEENARLARNRLYDANMNLARIAWDENHIDVVRNLLADTMPKSGEEDLRAFEWHYWDRLCHGELMTFKEGDDSWVLGVAFSPDGRTLASCSDDNKIQLWDAATGRQKMTLMGHSDRITGIAFSPDGNRLASASWDRTIKLWDIAAGKEIKTFAGDSGNLTCVKFSPDGKLLASGGQDGAIRIWDVETADLLFSIRGTGSVNCVAFSPDGKCVASCGSDTKIKLWDIATGLESQSLDGQQAWLRDVAFSPDGKLLASASSNLIELWDVATGRITMTLNGHSESVTCVIFSPDGKRLASASSDRTVRLWDVATGKLINTFKGHDWDVASLAFSPDGKHLASGSNNIKIWDVDARQDAMKLHAYRYTVKNVAFSPDGKRIASPAGTDQILLWEVATGQESLRLKSWDDVEVNCVAFSPNGAVVASGCADKTIKLWDLATKGSTTLKGGRSNVENVAFSPDGRYLISAGNSDVRLWDVVNAQEIKTLESGFTVTSLAFSPDGKYLAVADNKKVSLWDVATWQRAMTLPDGNYSVAFSRDGKQLATGGKRKITLWDAVTGQEVMSLQGHADAVMSFDFSPDGKRLASTSTDGMIKLWDLNTGQETLTLKGGGDVAFSPDGRRLASAGGTSDAIRIWDASPLDSNDANDQRDQSTAEWSAH